jgi:preprotein translocase subunit SecG
VDIVEIILWILQFVLGLGLIFLVLIHSGRGGGLSDMFGGGLGASAAGSTVMEKNLDRITVVVGLLLAFNTLIMAMVLDS